MELFKISFSNKITSKDSHLIPFHSDFILGSSWFTLNEGQLEAINIFTEQLSNLLVVMDCAVVAHRVGVA